MTPITIENAKGLLMKISNTSQMYDKTSTSNRTSSSTLSVYKVAHDSNYSDDIREIAFEAPGENEGMTIFINTMSKYKFSYFDFFDNDSLVVGNFNPQADKSSITLHLPLLNNTESLNLRNNNILKLRIYWLDQLRALLLWYVGYAYAQDEVRKMLMADKYRFTDSPFDISSSKAIGDKLLDKKFLLLFLKTTFGINEKPEYHRKTIKKIIGDQQEEYFYDSERSNYFKVLSLFSLLSIGKKSWHSLISGNNKNPSSSNNPATIEHKGLKDEKSIHTREVKVINDAILRCFYSQLIQVVWAKNRLLYDLIMPKYNCLSNFDLLLGEFDIYLQKLFDWHLQQKPGYVDGCELESEVIKKVFFETRHYVDTVLKKCEPEGNSKDDIILTLIKCASINRAKNDYKFILNIYKKMDKEIPDGIDLMKNVESLSEIMDVLTKIFNIEESEIPGDLIECAKTVIKLHSLFYDLEASPEQLRQYKEKNLSMKYIGACAAQILNGYIKTLRTGVKFDSKINIRGDSNPGINVYEELSKLTRNMHNADKDKIEFILYTIPDDYLKYLTSRYSIIYFGMANRCSIKNGALARLQTNTKKIELQEEVIELLREYSIQHICLFLNMFKKHVINIVNDNQHEIVYFDGMPLILPKLNESQIYAISKWLEQG